MTKHCKDNLTLKAQKYNTTGETGFSDSATGLAFLGIALNDAVNGAKTTLTSIMGRMATYTGKKITWDQALNSENILVPDDLDWSSEPPVMPDKNGNYPIPIPGVTKL